MLRYFIKLSQAGFPVAFGEEEQYRAQPGVFFGNPNGVIIEQAFAKRKLGA